ncbi:Transcriptional regulator, contains HTH domain [Halanaeroarchaeum sp. HSR-CO]|uniref:helix-turn-helix domain-containing protein n=1 Tax=Halanaeroarchaeum sp. HSR-CO TaxID=2866382 RepID=UPI00217EF3DF|nr:helix-turn-helix domain-containing protein [Halanaeroarchaeum sp. HSR-CO]UWG46410.1 Transcriptional regulator, contains HTH domain [Halanaeroarchaeum sp. HSR-CO]
MEPSIRTFGHPPMSPQHLLETVFDLSGEEADLYEWMVTLDDPIIPDDVVEQLGCSSSSAYRYLDTLQSRGLIVERAIYRKKQLRSGYVAADPEAVADALEEWVERRYELCEMAIEQRAFVKAPEDAEATARRLQEVE